jgi:hypothetical protein
MALGRRRQHDAADGAVSCLFVRVVRCLGFKTPASWSTVMYDGDYAAIADWFIFYFFLFGVLGVFFAGISAMLDKVFDHIDQGIAQGLRVFSLSLLFAAASTVSGWLLGLLFGIPRSLAVPGAAPQAPTTQQPDPAAGVTPTGTPAASAASRVNTNLEDVSDWLTKTIVGVGLTQLFYVPPFIWHVAGKLNDHGFAWDKYGQLLALCLFLYFAPGGFWLGYVGTRTILTKLLQSIDGIGRQTIEAAIKPDNLLLGRGGTTVRGAPDATVANADRVLLAKSLQSLRTPEEMAAWGAAQARARNFPAAQTAVDDALRTDPNNSEVKRLAVVVWSAVGRHADANRVLRDLPAMDLTVFNALYDAPPAGFRRAIEVGAELLNQPAEANNVNLRVWMACAYGQQFTYEQQTNPNSAELPAIKAKVLEEIRGAIAAYPDSRSWLWQLVHPAPNSSDNDLAVFANDQDVTDLLQPGAVPPGGPAPDTPMRQNPDQPAPPQNPGEPHG